MSLFGIQESDQRNIVNNNINNSVSNSSANIQDNTVVNRNICNSRVEVSADNIDTRDCPPGHGATLRAECNQKMDTQVNVFSQTDTDFDTTLTNNISNELKNKAKIETPSLMGSGLFSSQANHQLNKAVNSQQNDVRNDIYTKRTNMFNNDQQAGQTVHIDLGNFVGCDLNITASGVQDNMMKAVVKSVDTASASNSISNAMSNKFSNTVEMSGAGLWGVIGVCVGGLLLIVGGGAAGDDKKDNGNGKLIIFFAILTLGVFSASKYIIDNDESYEAEVTCPDNYKLDPNFSQSQIDACSAKALEAKDWDEKRRAPNFSRWKVEGTTTVSAQGGGEIGSSISLRGSVYDEEKGEIDYTTLNVDPYSDTDCGTTGYDANKNHIEGCRTIEEDYQWEQILKASCGCCGCDSERIDYYDNWKGGSSCYLDNSRPIGDFCDKGMDIIQPGVGYKTSGPDGVYNTTCRKRNNEKCKKRVDGQTLADIEDGDPVNLRVRLISHDSCVGETDNTLKCYQVAPNTGGFNLSGNNFFGEATNIRCKESDTWIDDIMGLVGACPGASLDANPTGCVKADKCVIDFKDDVNSKRSQGQHVSDSKSACDSKGANWDAKDIPSDVTGNLCDYKVNGVKEILIENKPSNHIDSPDNIYTVVKESVAQDEDMTTYLYLPGGQSVEHLPDSWNTLPEAPNPFRISSRLESSTAVKGTDHFHPFPMDSGVADCMSLDVIGSAKFNGFIIPKNIGTNLCDAKFRRLPACAKEDDKISTSSTFGCDALESSCMACKNEESDTVDEPLYENSLITDFSTDALTSGRGWAPLIAIYTVYIFISIALYIFMKKS